MSTTDTTFVVTLGRGHTVRVHRATCKKANNTVTLDELSVGELEDAAPASCCKPSPKAVQDAVAEVPTSSLTKPAEEPAEKPAEEPAVTVAMPQVLADKFTLLQGVSASDTTEITLTVVDSGMAKHYWRVFGRQAALYIGAKHGAHVRTKADYVVIDGPVSAVTDTVHVLTMLWRDGAEEFAKWRKTDPDYLEIKAADKGAHWFKSGRAAAELAYLQGLIENSDRYL